LVDPIHIVPEALTGKLRTLNPKQAWKHGLVVPFAGFCFAARRHATVEAGHQKILADGRPLISLLGDMLVNNGNDLKLLGNIKGSGRSTEFAHDNFLWLWARESESQLLGRADVFLPNDLGFAVNAAAFTQVIVGSSFDEFPG